MSPRHNVSGIFTIPANKNKSIFPGACYQKRRRQQSKFVGFCYSPKNTDCATFGKERPNEKGRPLSGAA